MPITAFSSFSDGLQPNQRSREHFITNTNLNDDNLWVPYADGVWFQPCCFNVTSGGFSLVLKGSPGLDGRNALPHCGRAWLHDAGSLAITEDTPEPMIAFFVVEGGLIYLDKPTNGGFTAYEDGFTLLELTRKHYREAGLDPLKLDLLVR